MLAPLTEKEQSSDAVWTMTHDMHEVLARQYPFGEGGESGGAQSINELTGSWGDPVSVSSYLDRCQVDTPADVVRLTWEHVRKLRPRTIDKVIDLGAGDGRFAHHGSYKSYLGYEIDADRCSGTLLPENAKLVNSCAFTDSRADADVCVGNPPFVRYQDIPAIWREHVRDVVWKRTGVRVSGLANAWQYFFLNALAILKTNGLAALIVPFEWVSRPSAKPLRAYIRRNRWNVYVYRLRDAGFARVLTTASITIVDKAAQDGKWEFHDKSPDGVDQRMASPTGSGTGVLGYLPSAGVSAKRLRAMRGLSPGTQNVLTLTEEQRQEHSLSMERDVAPCITSLRNLPSGVNVLDEEVFRTYFLERGRRCWLIRTNEDPGAKLSAYLSSVPESERQTRTCLARREWWRFKMPTAPSMLFAQGFRGKFPKVVRNTMGAHAIGGVCGIYNASDEQMEALASGLGGMDLRDHVVAYSSGFFKVEINQINALLARLTTVGHG